MDYRDIQKLRAFFSAFKDSGFKQDLKQIPSLAMIDGQKTPVDKAYCLQLLRKFPQFQGDKFKDDNAIIKYLSDPINRKFLLGNFTPEQQIELTKVLEKKSVTAAVTGEQPSGGETSTEQGVPKQAPVDTTAGMMGVPGLPSAPVIHNVPRVNRPERPPQVKTYPKPPVVETGLDYEGKPYEIPAKQAPQAEKATARAGRQTPKMPYQVSNTAKNFGSAAQRFIGTNLGRIGRGIAGPGLTGAYNLLGKVANGGLNAFGRLSSISGPKLGGIGLPKGLGAGKKVALAFSLVGLFFGFSLIAGIINPSTTPTSEASPVQGLNYTLPLKDPTIVPQDIKGQITAVFPQAKIDYWDKIIQVSKNANLNPALALALWVEETGASQTTVIRNGGSGIPTASGELTLGHLGCAPKEDQTIDESLSCLVKFINVNNFTNNDFAAFMAKYSSGPSSNPFANNPNFPGNLKSWYSKLVPSGVGAIQIITTQTVATCPIPGGKITTASYDADPINGHCGQSYIRTGFICPTDNPNVLPTQTRRAKSIDVVGGSDVYLPSIGGQGLNWKYLGVLPIAPLDCESKDASAGCGIGLIFQADLGAGHNWTLHLLHMDTSSANQFNASAVYPSGTKAGKLTINHLHMTVGKDVSNTTARYDPGWLPSDFMCR